MRHCFKTLYVLAAFAVPCAPAIASNTAVESAISTRPELSEFYKALKDTGVLGELNEGVKYTVLAPDNTAMGSMGRKQYPCFDAVKCRDVMASILRNHFVPGEEAIGPGGKEKGGLFSIGQRFIPVGQPSRNVYTVDGQRILGSSRGVGVTLYTVDGVIINKLEQPALEQAEERTTTVTRKTIPNPACGPEGCPDAYSETTIITRRVPEASPSAGD